MSNIANITLTYKINSNNLNKYLIDELYDFLHRCDHLKFPFSSYSIDFEDDKIIFIENVKNPIHSLQLGPLDYHNTCNKCKNKYGFKSVKYCSDCLTYDLLNDKFKEDVDKEIDEILNFKPDDKISVIIDYYNEYTNKEIDEEIILEFVDLKIIKLF